MTINVPSFASNYEYVVCYKNPDDEDILEYWSVETNGFQAERQCKLIEKQGLEPVYFHNVRIQGMRKGC